MDYFNGEYSFFLNSEDLHNPDLPLLSNKAKGGTLVLWRKLLDPFVTVPTPDSSSFLPIVLQIPNFRTSIHIALYLPTAGQDSQYLAELAMFRNALDDFSLKYTDPIFFLRGDANSSKKNKFRDALFTGFCKDYNLSRLPLGHMTYHHFLGHGEFDSDLDVLLYTTEDVISEELVDLHCKLEDPSVDSHHDILISAATIPSQDQELVDKSENLRAPRVKTVRQKVVWSEEGIAQFHQITSQLLPDLRARWQADSKASFSVLLQATNLLLQTAASETNKTVSLSSSISIKRSPKIPREIKKSGNAVAKANKHLKALILNTVDVEKVEVAKIKLKNLRQKHRKLVRQFRLNKCLARDSKLAGLVSDNPLKCFDDVQNMRKTTKKPIRKLHVDSKIYEDENIVDGFFDSISSLKKVDTDALTGSLSYVSAQEDYQNILKIVTHNKKIPPISFDTTAKILTSLKQSVNDYFSITPAHYMFSGNEGIEHLNFLMNAAIADLNNISVEELSTVWACVLFKGHGKDPFSDRSYRTISTCAMVSNALDKYISLLYSEHWHSVTADTQYQCPGSSHELAAVALTESINYSINDNVRPVFVLYLDARSAFDLVIREFLVQDLFGAGIKDQGLTLINERLKNRRTVCEWNKTLVGPILDECGVEQGGLNSSEFFKAYNNDQLNLAQASKFGISIGPVTISSIGQADDVALISDDLHALQALLNLSLYFCKKKHISLNIVKTKLQAFSSKRLEDSTYCLKTACHIHMDGTHIDFADEADHVGIIRSVHGNMLHLQSRFSAHRNQLYSILPMGLAKAHRANPAAAIRAHQIYCLPVLLSGTAALILKNTEVQLIVQHVKDTLSNLQKLLPKTPPCVVYFLGGHLPASALLHLRQLSLFSMVCRLETSALHKVCEHQL